MTSDDLEGNNSLCYIMRLTFGAHHENLNEDRPILPAAEM